MALNQTKKGYTGSTTSLVVMKEGRSCVSNFAKDWELWPLALAFKIFRTSQLFLPSILLHGFEFYMAEMLHLQWLGRQGAMRHSPIHLKNGPLESVQNVKKWPIENFKILKKSWKWPIGKNLFPITAPQIWMCMKGDNQYPSNFGRCPQSSWKSRICRIFG